MSFVAFPFSFAFAPEGSISEPDVQYLFSTEYMTNPSPTYSSYLLHHWYKSRSFTDYFISRDLCPWYLPQTATDKSMEFLDTTHCCFPRLTPIIYHRLDIGIKNWALCLVRWSYPWASQKLLLLYYLSFPCFYVLFCTPVAPTPPPKWKCLLLPNSCLLLLVAVHVCFHLHHLPVSFLLVLAVVGDV